MLELNTTVARPIPKNLLPHEVSYEKLINASRGNTYNAPIAITNVLVRLKTVRMQDASGFRIVGKAVMVYDYTNSTPNTIDFVVGDRITFNSRKYTVQEGDEQPTLQGQHHREIILL